MRRLWVCDDWSKYVDFSFVWHRDGMWLRFDKGVDPEVKRACKEFSKWLRTCYYFPIRVPVYIKSSEQVKTPLGEVGSAFFWAPFDKTNEPYISVSTGDYCKLMEIGGKDGALASILHSIAHELSHYFQWLKNMDLPIEKKERQAKYYSNEILYDYAEIRERP